MKSGVKKRLIDLYLLKRPTLLRFLTVRFRDDSIAEDILQEVYIKLQNASFDAPVHNEEGFLVRLTNNAALDFRKQTVRRKARDHAWGELHMRSFGGEPVQDEPSIERIVDGRNKIVRLTALIQQLPPRCQEVFIAHKLQGLSYAQVAEKLSISRSAVEKHMAKALKFLALNIESER